MGADRDPVRRDRDPHRLLERVVREGELVSLDLADHQFPGLIRRDQERRLQLGQDRDETRAVLAGDRTRVGTGPDRPPGPAIRFLSRPLVDSPGSRCMLLAIDRRRSRPDATADGGFDQIREPDSSHSWGMA